MIDKLPPAHAAERVAATVTYAASSSAVFFGLTANEFAAIVGVIVAALSLVANALISVYFKAQHLKLARDVALGRQHGRIPDTGPLPTDDTE